MPTFSDSYKNRVKAFLEAKFDVFLTDQDLIEACQSLFYIGRARARYINLKYGKLKPNHGY